jgi:cysteine synthase A
MSKQSYYIESVIDAIGQTPLVNLSRLVYAIGDKNQGRILAKLDYLNPGFSKKDRVAKQLIEDAEQSGSLSPGQTVIELTSGNTGTGLAIICAVKGYPFIAVMSEGNSVERQRMIASLGAEVVLVKQLPGSELGQVSGGDLELVEQKTQQLTRERNAFRADQFKLDGNFRAHYLHTGPEIIEQSQGKIDAFCDFVGSGGTFAGCAAAFKEHNHDIQCFVIEPENTAVLSGKKSANSNHRIQGGGYSKRELHGLDKKLIDGYLTASDQEAIDGARLLAKTEGIFAGFSSGANISAAINLLKGPFYGKTIVITINDSGLKYLSTELWANI